jgi:hypothetical protein
MCAIDMAHIWRHIRRFDQPALCSSCLTVQLPSEHGTYIRQPRPDFGCGFQVRVLEPFRIVLSSLESGAVTRAVSFAGATEKL